jgi:YebC/PmpR family DNA-binding regulatory protein
MAGHSHWAGIKRQKESTDKKRGKVFSKLLVAITVAARSEPNPDFNPRLRDAIQKAKSLMVPADNILRAIHRASDPKDTTEELVLEAYGPGGSGIIIEATTDNRNRTVAEIKKILGDSGAKWAVPGSVRWAFEAPSAGGHEWKPKFPQPISQEEYEKLLALIEALEEHDDTQGIFLSVTPERS